MLNKILNNKKRKKAFTMIELIIVLWVIVILTLIFSKVLNVNEGFDQSIWKINNTHKELYDVAISTVQVAPTESDVESTINKYVESNTEKMGTEVAAYCNSQDGLRKADICELFNDGTISWRYLSFDVKTVSNWDSPANTYIKGSETPFSYKWIGTNKIVLESCIRTEDENFNRCIEQIVDSKWKRFEVTKKLH